jgi:hypothetical protein
MVFVIEPLFGSMAQEEKMKATDLPENGQWPSAAEPARRGASYRREHQMLKNPVNAGNQV